VFSRPGGRVSADGSIYERGFVAGGIDGSGLCDGVGEIVRRGSRMIKRVRIDGCWYRTLDLEAGIRVRALVGAGYRCRIWTDLGRSSAVPTVDVCDPPTGGL
jgi:hypothetical protein